MGAPFKLKYKNSTFPFKDDKKKKQLEEKKMLEKRIRKDRMRRRRGEVMPITEENLQQYLDYSSGSKDLFV